MSDSTFKQAWQESISGDLVQDTGTESQARAKLQAHRLRYVVTGLTFAIAGVHLALAIATVAQGEISALSIAGVVPALAAAFLGVHALRRRSLPLCLASLTTLLAWTALHALT